VHHYPSILAQTLNPSGGTLQWQVSGHLAPNPRSGYHLCPRASFPADTLGVLNATERAAARLALENKLRDLEAASAEARRQLDGI
jgi:hypothetical protein